MQTYTTIIIMGAPRSGTTWLQVLLKEHPQVCSTTELMVLSKYTHPLVQTYEEQVRLSARVDAQTGLPYLFDKAAFLDLTRSFLEKVYDRVLQAHPQATHLIDKHPAYCYHVDHIHQLIPDAKFIHLIRDGRDVAASMIAAHRDMSFGPATVFGAAASWKRSVLAAYKARAFHPNYREVRYEDLLADPTQVLGTVFDFCGVSMSSERVEQIIEDHTFEKMKARRVNAAADFQTPSSHYRKGKRDGWREDLSAQERYTFNQIAGDLLVSLGYAEPGWWRLSSTDRVLAPLQHTGKHLGNLAKAIQRRIRSRGGTSS